MSDNNGAHTAIEPILLDVDVDIVEYDLDVDDGENIDSEMDMAVVVEKVSGVGIPPGGQTGQHLAKKSDEDYDVEWVDKEVFDAEYGVTTYEEIARAVEAGKAVYATKDGIRYQYIETTNNRGHSFIVIDYNNVAASLFCNDSSFWSYEYEQLALNVSLVTKVNHDEIADNFSTTTDYSVGDYVYYQNKLYRFIVEHPQGEWSTEDVVEPKLADDISEISEKSATKDSPVFTGVPEAPTAEVGTNTNQIATTAFVHQEISGFSPLPTGGNQGDVLINSGGDSAAWVAPASSAEKDNTRPITSAAVYTEIGNINALLATI